MAAIVDEREDLVTYTVETDGGRILAAGFPSMLGSVAVGDRVAVNTIGIDLELGTGDEGFVVWNLDGHGPDSLSKGHIIKLRYTPWQKNVLAVEAPESRHHDALARAEDIGGMPVVVCGLHSQIAGVAAGIKAEAPSSRVGYLMTDGGALPLQWSKLVRDLEEAELIDVTATCGHAFGGDLESVNAYSGLVALEAVAGCDVVVAGMGPGISGTATALGFSGMEVGALLDAAGALGGTPVACLRISFADRRERHWGVSHHSLTALRLGACRPCKIVVPELPADKAMIVEERLQTAGVGAPNVIVTEDGAPGMGLLRDKAVPVSSMGRSIDQDPELWLAASAAGRVSARLL